jgi:hypothetical protein
MVRDDQGTIGQRRVPQDGAVSGSKNALVTGCRLPGELECGISPYYLRKFTALLKKAVLW